MRTRRLGRLATLLAGTTILVLAAAPAVLAKEGVSVNLVAPLPGDAQPGTRVAALFTMEAISDDVVFPLSRATVFIRLFGPHGAMTEAAGVEQKTPGLYKAMVEIPDGGVSGCEFGIHGQAKTPSGKVVATDPVWRYDGVIVTAVIPKPVDPKTFQLPGAKPVEAPPVVATTTSTAPSNSATGPLALDPRVVISALALAGLLVAAGLGLRSRRHRATTAV